jgi:UDP-N-acetylmuramate dehydrogenase
MNYSRIKKIADKAGIKETVPDCNTARLCSMRAGGKAAALITVDNAPALADLLNLLEEENIRHMIIGDGTNIVFAGNYLDLVIIKLGKPMKNIEIDGSGKITAGAAADVQLLVRKAAARGLDLAFMTGIPGTLGGAVAGNSGSSGNWICGSIIKLDYIRKLEKGFAIEECSGSDLNAGYRSQDIPGMAAVISAVLKPARAEGDELAQRMRKEMDRRRKTQPVGARTSGCFFKNPGNTDIPAGALIDKCGLKGFSYGGARVSTVHANFIENLKDASPEDIVVLSRIMMDKVKESFGIVLEYEVKLIG